MSGFLRSYLSVVVFAGAAGLLVGGILGLSRLLQPRRPTEQKLTTYESGVDPTGDGWSQSQIRYYVFALLFVMFDVEAVFIFPWAVKVDALDQKFEGFVESLSPATGAKFSILPPENTSGNYVKVVQRLPVRLRLKPGQDNDHHLRRGMSVEPKVWLQ